MSIGSVGQKQTATTAADVISVPEPGAQAVTTNNSGSIAEFFNDQIGNALEAGVVQRKKQVEAANARAEERRKLFDELHALARGGGLAELTGYATEAKQPEPITSGWVFKEVKPTVWAVPLENQRGIYATERGLVVQDQHTQLLRYVTADNTNVEPEALALALTRLVKRAHEGQPIEGVRALVLPSEPAPAGSDPSGKATKFAEEVSAAVASGLSARNDKLAQLLTLVDGDAGRALAKYVSDDHPEQLAHHARSNKKAKVVWAVPLRTATDDRQYYRYNRAIYATVEGLKTRDGQGGLRSLTAFDVADFDVSATRDSLRKYIEQAQQGRHINDGDPQVLAPELPNGLKLPPKSVDGDSVALERELADAVRAGTAARQQKLEELQAITISPGFHQLVDRASDGRAPSGETGKKKKAGPMQWALRVLTNPQEQAYYNNIHLTKVGVMVLEHDVLRPAKPRDFANADMETAKKSIAAYVEALKENKPIEVRAYALTA